MASQLVTPGGVVTDTRVIEEPVDSKSRFVGLSFLITQIGAMIAYGLAGSFYPEPSPSQSAYIEIFSVVIMSLFVLVGFGLLLSTYRFATWLGITTAIMVVALSIQFGPLLQKFWFSIFITGFGSVNPLTSVGTNIQTYYAHFANNNIEVSSFMNRVTFLSCISLMVLNTAVIGRLGMGQLLKLVTLYQMFWNLNYYLLIYLATIKQDHNDAPVFTPLFFDTYGVTYNYIFAAGFGLIFTLLSSRQKIPTVHPRNQFNRTSLILSATGTAFIFAAFVFTGTEFIVNSQYGLNLTQYNIIWGLTGGVIGTYVGSLLFGKGRVGYKEALVGTISGGIVMGSAAAIIDSIGIVIMIGAVAGLFSGFYMRVLHPKINKNTIYDYLGLFGPFFISAFLGAFVVAPSAILWYPNNGIIPGSIGTSYYYTLAGWQLVYVGISLGIGIGSGLLVGILGCCDRQYFGLASNSRIYENDFGLYTPNQEIANIITPAPVPISVPVQNGNNIYVQNSNSATIINNPHVL